MLDDILKNIDLEGQITTHFRWKEALLLREWGFYVFPNERQRFNIFQTCLKLEDIRIIFNKREIFIRSFLRPEAYNTHIKGAPGSYHINGMAADFEIFGIEPEVVQKTLLDHAERLRIRVELDTPTWTHIDLGYKQGVPAFFHKPQG